MIVTNPAHCDIGDGPPPWFAEFMSTLMLTGSVRDAVEAAGIGFETAWAWRSGEPEFAMYWDRAMLVNKGLSSGLEFHDAILTAEAGVQ